MGQDTSYLNSLKYLKNYMEAIPMNIFFKDKECRYVYASEICEKLNSQGEGWSIIGKTEFEVQKLPELARAYYEDDLKILSTGEPSNYVSTFPGEDGTSYYEISKSPVRNDDGEIVGISGVVVDVTEKVELQRQMQEFYLTDPVTKLYNRKYLEAWQENSAPQFPLTLIVCDCNFLKKVNDTYGHESGDELLAEAGKLFRENLSENCIPIREGGDEFLILCNGTEEAQAEAIIHRLLENAKVRFVKDVVLSIAYGAYTMQESEYDFEKGHSIADKKMYEMKAEMKR